MSKLSGGEIAGIVVGAIITAIATAYTALTIKNTFINQANIISSLSNNNNNFEYDYDEDDASDSEDDDDSDSEDNDDDSEDDDDPEDNDDDSDNITQVSKTFQGLPLGLRLCHYVFGGDFSEATELYHYKVNSPSGVDKPINLQSIIDSVKNFILTNNSETMQAAKSNGKIPNSFKQINWDKCIIYRRILVSTNATPNGKYANLFYQGWLFDNAVKQKTFGEVAYPLIGVFYPTGAIRQSSNNDYYAPTDGSFKIFNQHIHRDKDSYAGHGNRDKYISYLILSNVVNSMAEAEEQADIQKIIAADYQLGENSSRIAINPDENAGTAFIICLDLSNFKVPKLMITYLLLVKDDPGMEYINEILTNKLIINTLINLPSPMPMPLKGGKSNHRRTVKRCKIYS